MPKTIQIRNVDDEIYAGLQRRAAEDGLSVPEMLRSEMARLASRPTMRTWLDRTRTRSSSLTTEQILSDLDAIRDEADARR